MNYTSAQIEKAVHAYINPEFSRHNCAEQANRIYLGIMGELGKVEPDVEQEGRVAMNVDGGMQSVSIKQIVDTVVEMVLERLRVEPVDEYTFVDSEPSMKLKMKDKQE